MPLKQAAPKNCDRWRTYPVRPARQCGHVARLKGFTSSHEGRYQKKAAAEIPEEWLLELPLLTEFQGPAGLPSPRPTSPTTRECIWPATSREGPFWPRGYRPVRTTRRRPGESAAPSPWRVHDRGKGGAAGRVGPRCNPPAPAVLPRHRGFEPGKTTFPWWNGLTRRKSLSRWA